MSSRTTIAALSLALAAGALLLVVGSPAREEGADAPAASAPAAAEADRDPPAALATPGATAPPGEAGERASREPAPPAPREAAPTSPTEAKAVAGRATLSCGAPAAGFGLAFVSPDLRGRAALLLARGSSVEEVARPGQHVVRAEADENGAFRVELPPELARAFRVLQLEDRSIAQVARTLSAADAPLELVWTASRVDLTVLLADGSVEEGIRVVARIERAGDPDRRVDEVARRTDESGRARFVTGHAGSLSLVAHDARRLFEARVDRVPLPPEGAWSERVLRLLPVDGPCAIALEIEWDDGTAIDPFTVELEHAETEERIRRVDSTDLGSSRIVDRLPEARITVSLVERYEDPPSLYDPDRSPTATVESAAGELPRVRFVQAARGRALLDLTAMPSDAGAYRVLAARAAEPDGEDAWQRFRSLRTPAADGVVHVGIYATGGEVYYSPPLAPGEWRFRLLDHEDDVVLARARALVATAGVSTVRFRPID